MKAESEGPHVRLGDHVDLLTGFPFQSSEFTDDPKDIRLLRGDNVSQGELRWDGAKRWPAGRADKLEKFVLREGDVILAMDRPWIEAGLKFASVTEQDVPSLLVQRVARLRAKPSLEQGFLRYLVASKEFTDYVVGIQTGTAVPHISGAQIQSFRFSLPPLPVQASIAHVLGSLDTKTQLNRRMNQTLEQISQILFKSWFIDFDPVRAKAEGRWKKGESLRGMPADMWGLWPSEFEESEVGKTPRSWTLTTVGGVTQTSGGSTPFTGNPSYWEGGNIPWATPSDLGKLKSPVLLDTEKHLTPAGLEECISGLLPKHTVLLSSSASIGYLAVAAVPTATNQGFISLRPSPKASPFFLFEWVSNNMSSILELAHGTTFQRINLGEFANLPICLPPLELMARYHALVQPLFERMVAGERECIGLSQVRDVLLPKLLSGEIRLHMDGTK